LTPEQILRRALQAAKASIIAAGRYKLGKGGRKPSALHPFDSSLCDCSGFVAWALGFDRYQPHMRYYGTAGGWISTRSMEADARAGGPGLLTMVPEADALPGDVIVFGTKTVLVGKRRKKRIGHCGIVSRVAGGRVTHVIHCSSGNDRAVGTAIAETPLASFWRKRGAIFARYRDDEPTVDPEV
jgi:cell wall-associated NlpC family hydrolase